MRTNPKSSGSYPIFLKLLKYLYYIILNYSGAIRELKSSKLAFSENLPRRLSGTRRKELRILRTYPELSKQHYIIIINSYLSIRSPEHGLTKSRILPEYRISYRIDLIYSDFTRILPISQIQYTQAYSTHFISIRYTTKLLGAPEY